MSYEEDEEYIDTDKYEAMELEQMIHDAGYPEIIDTDKYEGHTEGLWEVLCGSDLLQEAYEHDLKHAKPYNPDGGDKMGIGHLNLYFLKTPFNNAIPEHITNRALRCSWAEGYAMEWFEEEAANAQLMADAPKLLAEVKRLREESKKKGDVLTTLDEMIRNEENHVEMMKALEQGLDLPETWKEMIE